jgi:hypothetical protein
VFRIDKPELKATSKFQFHCAFVRRPSAERNNSDKDLKNFVKLMLCTKVANIVVVSYTKHLLVSASQPISDEFAPVVKSHVVAIGHHFSVRLAPHAGRNLHGLQL